MRDISLTVAIYKDKLDNHITIIDTMHLARDQMRDSGVYEQWSRLLQLMEAECEAIADLYEFYFALSKSKAKKEKKEKDNSTTNRKTNGSHLTLIK